MLSNLLVQLDSPLFPDVIWSRPETKQGSGKLLIIGGSAGAMAHVSADYMAAEMAGAGTIHLLVPNSLEKVTRHIPFVAYTPSTPSGSFAKEALGEMLALAQNVDGVLLSGDMGKNSETSLLLERFVQKYSGPMFVSSEAQESLTMSRTELVARENTTLFLTFNQLQSLGIELKLDQAITSDLGQPKLADILHKISLNSTALLAAQVDNDVWVAHQGKVAICKNQDINPSTTSIWQIQQPTKPFEAIVSSYV